MPSPYQAFANTADFASAIVVIARASRLLDTTVRPLPSLPLPSLPVPPLVSLPLTPLPLAFGEQDPTIVPYAHRVIAQVLPALQRTEDALVQPARQNGQMAERTRTFFVESLRGVRGDLAGKAAAAAGVNGR